MKNRRGFKNGYSKHQTTPHHRNLDVQLKKLTSFEKNRAEKLFDWLIAFFLAWTLTFIFDPSLAFKATHVAGGDMIAHPWLAHSLKTAFSEGRFWGWNQGWFAGFPFLYFYFYPVYLIAVCLNAVGIPEPIAYKVTVLGIIFALPVVYYLTARKWLTLPLAILFTVLGIGIFFHEFGSFAGGNFKSVLAGQVSHQLGLIAMVGIFSYLCSDDLHSPIYKLLYAVAILSHVYSALFSTLIIGLYALAYWFEKKSLVALFHKMRGSILVIFLCSFWWLPFLYYRNNTVAPLNQAVVNWDEVIRLLQFSSPLHQFLYLGSLLLLAINIVRKKTSFFEISLVFLAILTIIAMTFSQGTPILHVRLPPEIYLLTLMIFMIQLHHFKLNEDLQWIILAPLSLLLLQSLIPSKALDQALPAFARNSVKEIPRWWQWNMSGIESKPNHQDVAGVWQALKNISDPEGRVAVEFAHYNRFGSDRIFEMTPYFTNKPIMEGLLHESSSSYPAYFYISLYFNPKTWWPGFPVDFPPTDVKRGVELFSLYNVKYFVAHTDPVKTGLLQQGYEVIHKNNTFTVFHINPESRIASILNGVLPKMEAKSPLLESVLGLPVSLDYRIELTQGFRNRPESLKKVLVIGADQSLTPLDGEWSSDGQTYTVFNTGAQTGDPREILFKIPYFPNWKTDTGESMRLVTPNLMLVKTEQKRLSIHFQTGTAEKISLLLSLIALVLLIVEFVIRKKIQ